VGRGPETSASANFAMGRQCEGTRAESRGQGSHSRRKLLFRAGTHPGRRVAFFVLIHDPAPLASPPIFQRERARALPSETWAIAAAMRDVTQPPLETRDIARAGTRERCSVKIYAGTLRYGPGIPPVRARVRESSARRMSYNPRISG
jgi:hypothetical protein